jgi:hypothetical protein
MNNRILILGLLALLPASRSNGSSIAIYTDETSFLNQVVPGRYLETFEGLTPLKNLGTDLYFSSNGYSYHGHASGGYSYNNGEFYGAYLNFDRVHAGDLVLGASQQGTVFNFDFLNGNITAVGGTFMMLNNDSHVTTGMMNITLQDGTVITFYDLTPFYGFTSETPITQITVDSNRFSAMNNLYVGTFVSAVPEPASTALMLLGGTGLILLGRYRSRTCR